MYSRETYLPSIDGTYHETRVYCSNFFVIESEVSVFLLSRRVFVFYGEISSLHTVNKRDK